MAIKGCNHFQSNFQVGQVVLSWQASSYTRDPTWIFGVRICPLLAPFFCMAWLLLIPTWRCSWICCFAACTWSALTCRYSRWLIGSLTEDIRGSTHWIAKTGEHFVDSETPLFAVISAIGSQCTQWSYWWLTNTCSYCSIPTFIRSVWLSVWGWNAVDILQSIPKQSHIGWQKAEANQGRLLLTIVAGNSWRHTPSCRNNLDNPTAWIVIWQEIKWCIIDILSATTQITSNPSHYSQPSTWSIEISADGFSGTGNG